MNFSKGRKSRNYAGRRCERASVQPKERNEGAWLGLPWRVELGKKLVSTIFIDVYWQLLKEKMRGKIQAQSSPGG